MIRYCIIILIITTGIFKTQGQNKVEYAFDTVKLFKENFTGFMLYDPETGDTIASINEKKFFNPASNVKIFTFYTALKLIPEYLSSCHYFYRGDTVYIMGTGDPTFLHPDFEEQPLLEYLKHTEKTIVFLTGNYEEDHYGPGWAWDDYTYFFSNERASFPVCGNALRVDFNRKDSTFNVYPDYFLPSTMVSKNGGRGIYRVSRNITDNTFTIFPSMFYNDDPVNVPLDYDDQVLTCILEDTLQKPVFIRRMPEEFRSHHKDELVMRGGRKDTVLKKMMIESDNFIAEQLLINASSFYTDSLSTELIIKKMQDTLAEKWEKAPIWRDGSGLSRYNLFSPIHFVTILDLLYDEFEDKEELMSYFPVAGQTGTLKYFLKDTADNPYLWGKTGSLNNNFNMSGYIKTKSGKTLIFSFMNNHYTEKTSIVKGKMETIFKVIHENY
ncbi:D-alanyl-D-alanine carboxypeptidase/D-alanyl-D-alanine-endopeptidase [Marinigracilibium pacificum]|uniref:D-alanyl-D-alanine carboxypeptidase n=1 Tax=Marinigracilibium pacificum TaxID=2729599 RepID=A0A848J7S4_9BACT|nr:D-alanyl-D-alanine carboxypeptidase [Marinigracilibium pacificum]NMM50540.1 D-alanyl-D-alanine carboxypeptidase [Marinigracilibium pacificum]